MASVKRKPGRPKEKPTLLQKLRSTYRLLLINDSTFEERFSIKLNRLNVLLLAFTAFTVHGLFVTAVIVLTPLKQLIPGYSDQATKANAYHSMLLADSLEVQLAIRDMYIDNLRGVLSGELKADSATLFIPLTVKPDAASLAASRADSVLRARIEKDQAYSLDEGRVPSDRR